MQEQKILAALAQSREAWAIAAPSLTKDDFSPEGGLIYDLVNAFYEADTAARRADPEILAARADREIANSKVSDIVQAGLKKLGEADVSAVNVAKEVVALRAHGLGLKIASILASGKPSRELPTLLTEYMDLSTRENITRESENEEFIGLRAEDLVRRDFDNSNLLQLWPSALNEHIDGGLRGGHHVLVFAPTEMGKTLFVINACCGFLKQGASVLYVGNEDPAPDIMMRMMSRLTGMNKYEIKEAPAKADSILAKRNWELFTFANLAPGTFPRIHRLIEKYRPKVLILDQLRNIDVSSENRTQALEKAATEARNTAKRFGIPVISVAQAADSASGRTVLGRGDVDSSNVGIPGQCDLMIGIGANEEMEHQCIRILSFPKNKLSGRHEPLTITIDPLLSKVVE